MRNRRSLALALAVITPVVAVAASPSLAARAARRPAPRTVLCLNTATGKLRAPLTARCLKASETTLRVSAASKPGRKDTPNTRNARAITICVSPYDDMTMRMPADGVCRYYETKFRISVVGPQGPVGPAGKDGANGADGANGRDGATGPAGPEGGSGGGGDGGGVAPSAGCNVVVLPTPTAFTSCPGADLNHARNVAGLGR